MDKRFDKWKQGLARTRKTTFGRIANLLGTSEIDADTWDDLEAMLVHETGLPPRELADYRARRGKFLSAIVRADLETSLVSGQGPVASSQDAEIAEAAHPQLAPECLARLSDRESA